MSYPPLFLCGFMGVGKSTVGKVLADRLQLPFFDTDQVVIRAAGKTIPKIFAEDGENHFRELESEAIQNVSTQGSVIVALGGGALNSRENFECIKKNGKLIYLAAGLETLKNRLQSTAESRPLLAGLDQDEKSNRIEALLKSREELYRKADLIVNTDGRKPAEIADEIMRELRRSLS